MLDLVAHDVKGSKAVVGILQGDVHRVIMVPRSGGTLVGVDVLLGFTCKATGMHRQFSDAVPCMAVPQDS